MIEVAFGAGDASAAYDGPLDLLLGLVRRHAYSIDAIPVAEITRRYRSYLREAGEADIELGGEYIELASWLVLLQSRALLPAALGEEPPERELARALLDRETLKATAAALGERLRETGPAGFASGWDRSREENGEAGEAAPPSLSLPLSEAPEPAAPTVADALAAARRALAAARDHARGTELTAPDPYPAEQVLAVMETRLQAPSLCRGVSTEQWFAALPGPEPRAALLLALLELARAGRILIHQHAPLAPLLLQKVTSSKDAGVTEESAPS